MVNSVILYYKIICIFVTLHFLQPEPIVHTVFSDSDSSGGISDNYEESGSDIEGGGGDGGGGCSKKVAAGSGTLLCNVTYSYGIRTLK